MLEPSPPFRIASLSPKLCISSREIEIGISARCALQYVVGLELDHASGLAHISYGLMDRRMGLVSLPISRLVALARTHTVGADEGPHAGPTVSECARWQ